jgi:hypothetical protein
MKYSIYEYKRILRILLPYILFISHGCFQRYTSVISLSWICCSSRIYFLSSYLLMNKLIQIILFQHFKSNEFYYVIKVVRLHWNKQICKNKSVLISKTNKFKWNIRFINKIIFCNLVPYILLKHTIVVRCIMV